MTKESVLCVIAGLFLEADENCALLGCYRRFQTPEFGADRVFRNVGKKLLLIAK